MQYSQQMWKPPHLKLIHNAALGLVRLLGSVNNSLEQSVGMKSFCAAYMSTVVTEALMTQADRRGFTLLAKPSEEFIEGTRLISERVGQHTMPNLRIRDKLSCMQCDASISLYRFARLVVQQYISDKSGAY